MNDEQLLRYSRHILLPGFDYQGQQSLLDARVLIVGLGGLGCSAAMYLAAAGVGSLWLADFDTVELSNLQRQIAHATDDIGRPKAVSASETLKALNPDIDIECISEHLTGQILIDAVNHADVVVDASDNFDTRFEVNRACVAAKKPLVSGAAIGSEGQLIVFDSRNDDSPCYHCLYQEGTDDTPLSCTESGVLAPLVGVIGSLQAIETIKILSAYGEAAVGKLLIFDAKTQEWSKLSVPKSTQCPVCASS